MEDNKRGPTGGKRSRGEQPKTSEDYLTFIYETVKSLKKEVANIKKSMHDGFDDVEDTLYKITESMGIEDSSDSSDEESSDDGSKKKAPAKAPAKAPTKKPARKSRN